MHRIVAMLVLVLALGAAPAALAMPVPGQKALYQLEYASTTHSDLRALFGMAADAPAAGLVNDIEARLQGEMERVAFQHEGKRLAAIRLRNLQVALRINDADAQAHAAQIAKQLQGAPLLVELDPDGAIAGVRFDAAMDEATRAYARALLAALQFAGPRSDVRTWEREEDDQAGRYVARYVRDGIGFERVRRRYLPATPNVPGAPGVTQVIEPSGSTRVDFAADRSVLKLAGDERQRVTVNGKQIATGATTVRLQRVRVSDASKQELATLGEMAGVRGASEPLSIAALAGSSDAAMHRSELGAETVDSLLTRLHALPDDETNSPETTELYLKFKALVYLQPESSVRLGDELALAKPNGAAMLMLSQALAAIGHAQAQAALASAMQQRAGEWPALATLVPTLGGIATPTDATVDALLALAASANPETASLARLALGGLARRAAHTAPDRAARALGMLRAGLRRTPTTDEHALRDFLLALGNAADRASLPAIRAHANHASADVRAAAQAAIEAMEAQP